MIAVRSKPIFPWNAEKLVQSSSWTAFGGVIIQFFLHALCIIAISLFSIAKGEIKIESGGLIFKPIEIKPSPNGKDYEGVFVLVNNTKKTIEIPLLEMPVGRKIRPANTSFQTFANGRWTQEESFDGILASRHPIKPGTEYEIFVDIMLEELPKPVTARLGFTEQNLWSEAFILNWKKDREEGNFLRSKMLHIQKVKEAFEKGGFKNELLGDGFCDEFFQEIIVAISSQQKSKLFEPVAERVEVLPRLYLNGEIDASANYGKQSNQEPLYSLQYSMDPSKFNRAMFDKYRTNIEVMSVGKHLVMMLLIRKNPEDEALFDLTISYRGVLSGSDSQIKSEANEVFKRALAVVSRWLK